MKKSINKKNNIKYLELFAGIGGFRVAIERAAHANEIEVKCVGYSEIDSSAIKTYKANFGTNSDEIEIGDVTSLDSDFKIKKIPKFDILLAGFPCQPFSLWAIRRVLPTLEVLYFSKLQKF